MTSNHVNGTHLIYCGILKKEVHGGLDIINRISIHLSSNDQLLLCAQISTVLIISLFLQILLKPFNQPRVVSDMIGGLIIGPSILGRYKEFSSLLFPERSNYMLQTMTQMSMMLFFFVNGVQMDVTMIWKARRRAYFIGLIGAFLPIMTMTMAFAVQRHSLEKYFNVNFSVISGLLSTSVSVTSVHVLYPILKELDILNTDIGRLSISSAIISDMIGWVGSITFGIHKQNRMLYKLAYLSTYLGFMFFAFSVVRPAAIWVNRRTPNGCRVNQVYVMIFLLGIMVSGFITDLFGSSMIQGPLMLGLALPEGPPLGAALVKRTEAVMANIFIPVLFAQVGLICDVFSINGWATMRSLLVVVVVGYLAKFLSTMLASFFFKMPIRDAISLGLVMSFRAQAELTTFLRWKSVKMLDQPAFTVLVLSTTAVTSISTFLIRAIYIPTLSYMTNKPRTILHSGPNTKFNIVACVYNQETVPALMDLLRASNPTINSPISVYVLQLIELIGKYRSIFINHNDKNNNTSSNNDKYSSNVIWKAFEMYKQTIGNPYISFHMFTIVSPYKIMYHEICKLALEKKATMIILPVHNEYCGGGEQLSHPMSTSTYYASQLVNSDVMVYAPCSVGFLIARDPKRNILLSTGAGTVEKNYRVIVLFLGGGDAREALAYADLMVSKQNVSLTVARFWAVAENNDSNNILHDKFYVEDKLDQECFSWFVTKNLSNDRIQFVDFEVNDGVETIDAIREIDRNGHDLWMVGKERGMNPVFVQGLSEDWMSSSHHELGAIGDFISSPDFEGAFSVLVVQQQVQDVRLN